MYPFQRASAPPSSLATTAKERGFRTLLLIVTGLETILTHASISILTIGILVSVDSFNRAGPALRIWWPGARQKLRPHSSQIPKNYEYYDALNLSLCFFPFSLLDACGMW
jgi:hypothetical protein